MNIFKDALLGLYGTMVRILLLRIGSSIPTPRSCSSLHGTEDDRCDMRSPLESRGAKIYPKVRAQEVAVLCTKVDVAIQDESGRISRLQADRIPVGARRMHILGEHATELIGEAVTAMSTESAVEDLAEVTKPHPSLTENLIEGGRDWNGVAVHGRRRRWERAAQPAGRRMEHVLQ